MGDQRRSSDECPICFEAFDDHVISLSPRRPFPVGRLLCWPCGHRVHLDCMLQSQASVSRMEDPCFQCRTPAYPGLRRSFAIVYGADIMSMVPPAATTHAPTEDHPVPANAVRIPRVAALCCPRVVGPIDGEFFRVADDRRMTYMGVETVGGAMRWTCLSCGKHLWLMDLPPLGPSCGLHGAMCFVLDWITGIGLQEYWTCTDDRFTRNDVPLPIRHLLLGRNENNTAWSSQPIEVASSSDEDTLSPMSLTDLISEGTLTRMQQDNEMEETCIPQLVYLKARLQPHPCCIGHNANILKRGGYASKRILRGLTATHLRRVVE